MWDTRYKKWNLEDCLEDPEGCICRAVQEISADFPDFGGFEDCNVFTNVLALLFRVDVSACNLQS